MGEEILRYHFTVVKLWEIPPERVLSMPYIALWPLAGVMGEGKTDVFIRAGTQIAEAPVSREERSELAALLTAPAGIRQPREVIREALGRNSMLNDLVRESSAVADWLDEGRAEGLRATVCLDAHGRFGSLDERLEQAIAGASNTALEAAFTHVASDTPEQLRVRLVVARTA